MSLQPALDGVDVRVDEPGVQHPAREIDDLGAGPAPGAQVGADRGDAPVDDGDLQGLGSRRTATARASVDDSSEEEQVSVGHGPW